MRQVLQTGSFGDAALRAQQLVEDGLALHRENRLEEAAALYRQALELSPAQPDALYLLGLNRLQCGRPDEALAFLSRAAEANPGFFAVHVMRGNALAQLGQAEAAVASFGRALALNPQAGDIHGPLGSALLAAGRPAEALESLDRALAFNPGDLEARAARGAALHRMGRPADALADLDAVLAADPRAVAAHANRAEALKALGRLQEALDAYDRAGALEPGMAALHANRSVILRELRRYAEAEAACRAAIALQPDYAEAHYNLGGVLDDAGRWEEAAAAYARALSLRPAFPEAHYGQALMLHRLMRAEEAIAHYDAALSLAPAYLEARWNRALALLLAGRFQEGWAEHETRWLLKTPEGRSTARDFDRPQWTGAGEALQGRTVLLHAEQGLGDTLQFCRYAAAVKARGAGRVVLEVQPPLVALLQGLAGVDEVLGHGEPLPAFDLHCPLMSLPLALDATLESIPPAPYLRAAPDKVQAWRARLGGASRPRVGLVWSGGERPDQPELAGLNARRNLPLSKLAPLAGAAVDFVSLQKGAAAEAELAERRAAGWDGPAMLDVAAELHDFSDTAALVEALDLVISVDTSTAHLAGALGKPVWILNRFDSCWRWLTERRDSPWYPSAVLFRQPAPGDWDGVVREVRAALDAFAGG